MVEIMLPSEHRARSLANLHAMQQIQEAKAKANEAIVTQQRAAQMRSFFNERGPDLANGDPTALADFARLDPKGAQEFEGRQLENAGKDVDLQAAEGTLEKNQAAAQQEQLDHATRALTAVQFAAPEVRGLFYKQQLREYRKKFPDTDFSGIPEDYDENAVKQMLGKMMSAKEQFEAQKSPEKTSRPPRAIYDPTSPTGQRLVPEEDAIGQPTGTLPGTGSDAALRSQQSDTFLLPDGTKVKAEFIPNKGLGYRKNGTWTLLPEGAEPTTPSAGGMLTPQQFLGLREKFTQEQQALQRLNRYGESVGGINVGLQNWADAVGAKVKTAFGDKSLSQAEFARLSAQGQQQALLGLFRVDVVGPGVMTEFDAQRVVDALGGNVNSLLNPTIVQGLLKNLYSDKMQRLRLYEGEIARNAPVFGVDPLQITAPPEFGGTGAPMPEAVPAAASAGDVPPGTEEFWQHLTPEEQNQWPR